jgi:3-deoxy-manno-octulosonate cytidylyltransferase (CMP-KDO synthetase)
MASESAQGINSGRHAPRVLAVIPARLASTRLPEKPLADICGKPMIQWVYERTTKAETIDKVVVATDSSRIEKTVCGFGGCAMLTSPEHESGTDRLVEVAGRLDAYDIVLNVQGDEPLIDPAVLDFLVGRFIQSGSETMGTLVRKASFDEAQSPNSVKVVRTHDNRAIYFSRNLIPHDRGLENKELLRQEYLLHIGIYIFKRNFLLKFPQLKQSSLEQREKLEQLRVLENGYPIHIFQTTHKTLGVDTEEDLEKVRLITRDLTSS